MPERSDRLRRARAALAGAGVDALVVNAPANTRYLTGYAGSNGAVVLTAERATFMTDFRYAERAAELESLLGVEVVDRDLLGTLAGRLGALTDGAARIGFETSLSYAGWRTLADGAGTAELVPVSGLVEGLRVVKSASELDAIREVMRALDGVYARVAEDGLVGRTEQAVAWSIERMIREAGYPAISFSPIVASGPHGALPHAEPRDVAIAAGDLVVIDIGARGEDGYCSDCTRTLAAGRAPADGALDDYRMVQAAQLAGLDAVRAGVTGVDADAAARRLIDEYGAGPLFGHGLGHGIGLEVHEAPVLRTTSTDVLAAGNVVSVEPGIYRPGAWGIRIEDAVAVTETGCEILTGFPKELVETG